MKQFSRLLGLSVLVLLLNFPMASIAQSYPSHAVSIIIPFPPGGTLDTVGRMLAQKLSEQTGQSFVVENRAGAGGVIGANAVGKSNPDGYSLLFSASTFASAPMVVKGVVYDVERDFAPIALVAKAPLAVAVNNSLPVNNIADLIAYSKSKNAPLSFAIGSLASAGHLSTELLKKMGGIDYTAIQYKGSSPAYNDLIGGRLDGFVDPILGSAPFAKAGQLKVIAVTSSARLPNMPNTPVVAETLPGYEYYSWYGLWGPSKLPANVAQFLNDEVNKALLAMAPRLREQGLIETPGSIEQFAKFQSDDMKQAKKLIDEGGIHAE
jgi:tripartite-type tricarboxylate transporter receptor subunit TctC